LAKYGFPVKTVAPDHVTSGAFHIPDEVRQSPALPNEMISETIARYHLHTRPAARGLCILSERIGS